MNRRDILGLIGTAPLLSGCIYERFFEIEWDEEAQQPDGALIVVRRREKWKRYSQGLTPYGGRNLFVESTLTIDAGGSIGRVSQLFRGFAPQFIGRHGGAWYTVIKGAYPSEPPGSPVQNWGKYETDFGQLALELVHGAWTPISMRALPNDIQTPNLLLPAEDLTPLAKFSGRLVRLRDKNGVGREANSPARARLIRPQPRQPVAASVQCRAEA
jgi:hypothetical protein